MQTMNPTMWALVDMLDFAAVGVAGVMARFTHDQLVEILVRWGAKRGWLRGMRKRSLAMVAIATWEEMAGAVAEAAIAELAP